MEYDWTKNMYIWTNQATIFSLISQNLDFYWLVQTGPYYCYCTHANELFSPFTKYMYDVPSSLPPLLPRGYVVLCYDRRRPTVKRRNRSINFSTIKRQLLSTPLAMDWSSKTSKLNVSHARALIGLVYPTSRTMIG